MNKELRKIGIILENYNEQERKFVAHLFGNIDMTEFVTVFLMLNTKERIQWLYHIKEFNNGGLFVEFLLKSFDDSLKDVLNKDEFLSKMHEKALEKERVFVEKKELA